MEQSTLFPRGNQPRCIIVTGDRHGTNPEWGLLINRVLINLNTPGSVLIHGAQQYTDDDGVLHGIDTIAALWANGHYSVIAMPAQWDKYGKPAGPKRNRAMIRVATQLEDCGYDVRVLAFHNTLEQSRGTKDMVVASRQAGFSVTVYSSDGKVRS